jgi:hypothetical protein
MEITIGTTILKCAIFDRDYRSPKELDAARKELSKVCDLAYIHNRKEIENYLPEPGPLGRAIRRRIEDRKRRGPIAKAFDQDIRALLMDLSEPLKTEIQGQYLAKRAACEKQDISQVFWQAGILWVGQAIATSRFGCQGIFCRDRWGLALSQ